MKRKEILELMQDVRNLLKLAEFQREYSLEYSLECDDFAGLAGAASELRSTVYDLEQKLSKLRGTVVDFMANKDED